MSERGKNPEGKDSTTECREIAEEKVLGFFHYHPPGRRECRAKAKDELKGGGSWENGSSSALNPKTGKEKRREDYLGRYSKRSKSAHT